MELNPQYVEALIHQGLVLNELGRTDEAEEAFGRAAAAPGRSPRPACPRRWLPSWPTGTPSWPRRYAGAGALSRAIEQYERALELGPEFHDLRYRMARLLLEAGRALEAREALEEVVRGAAELRGCGGRAGSRPLPVGRCWTVPGEVWEACLARRPENARVEAYLAMLTRAGQ